MWLDKAIAGFSVFEDVFGIPPQVAKEKLLFDQSEILKNKASLS